MQPPSISSLALLALSGVFQVTPIVSSAQQYAGEKIESDLRDVDGAELAFFKIADPAGGDRQLTLLNYYSHNTTGDRIVENDVKRAVIFIHGLHRHPHDFIEKAQEALDLVDDDSITADNVAMMAPYFGNGNDKGTAYPWEDGKPAGEGSTSSALVWKGSQWSAGGDSQYPAPHSDDTEGGEQGGISSYYVMDEVLKYFANKKRFPHMQQIVVAGHSLGGQMTQRYAVLTTVTESLSVPVTFWIANPNSYAWLATSRPEDVSGCTEYDDYRMGYHSFNAYPMTYGADLVAQGRKALLDNYQAKNLAYARGRRDEGSANDDCASMAQGKDRNARFLNFIEAFPPTCDDPTGHCHTVDYIEAGHRSEDMFSSNAGLARIFRDNFNGDGSRAYDFGYPRQKSGDDPFPDPDKAD